MGQAGSRTTRPRSVGQLRIAVAAVAGVFSFATVQVASAATATPTLAKSYTGSARNVTAVESAPITLTGITQTGGTIAGAFAFHAPLVGSGPFAGAITSTKVNFTVKPTATSCPSCSSIVFTGTVSPLVSLSGTWVAHLKSGSSQNGTWGVGSTWSGTFHNTTQNVSGSMALADLTEKANGSVAGSVVVYPPYGGGGPFTGSVTGDAIKMTSVSNAANLCSDCTIVWVGTVSTFGSIGGTYLVKTDNERGTWQVHRSGATATAV